MKYLFRSVKYLIAICVLCLLVTWVSSLMDPLLSFQQRLVDVIHSQRGQLMLVVLVGLSAFYPLFGFMKKRLAGNITVHRRQIVDAFEEEGFVPLREDDHELTFRARSFLKKLLMLFEDRIDVQQEGDFIRLSGNRRAVARIHYRLQTYLSHDE